VVNSQTLSSFSLLVSLILKDLQLLQQTQ
jgi:hypothetical protein